MKRNTAALVTGASGGLGTAFARLCAEDGYDLVLSARNEEKLNRLKEELEQKYGIKAYVCPADLSKPDEALKILKYTEDHHLEIEILINNASFGDAGAFAESDWNREASCAGQCDCVDAAVSRLPQANALIRQRTYPECLLGCGILRRA